MLYKKKGLPERDEIVLCTVKRILHNSVFVDLDEYEKKEGIIHISEISPGRIRTIREFVREGKKIACKVLRINEVHGNIELSLRRVNLAQKIKKLNDYKLELKAKKLIEVVAESMKENKEALYEKVSEAAMNSYGSLHGAFQDVVVNGESVLIKLSMEKKIAAKLTEFIKQRMKPAEVRLVRVISVKVGGAQGIEEIRNAFKKGEDLSKAKGYGAEMSYLGSPLYRIEIKAGDYKKANAEMAEMIDVLKKGIVSAGGTLEVEKEK